MDQNTGRRPNSKSVFLLFIILSLVSFIGWQQGAFLFLNQAEFPQSTVQAAPAQPPVSITQDNIVKVELRDINFWEARFNVTYRQAAGGRRQAAVVDT